MSRGILTALWLLVGCVAHAAPRVEATPGRVVLGRDGEVRIRVVPEGGAAPLRWTVSAGRLSEVGSAGEVREFRWAPPDIRYPTRALIAFWHEREGAPPDPFVLELPLIGRTDLEMKTAPGAEVRVEIGDQSFGPTRANRRGVVRVPIEVPPGVREARVEANDAGQKTHRTVPLEVPTTRPVAIAASPHPLRHDGGYLIVARASGIAPDAVAASSDQALERVEDRGQLTFFRISPAEGATQTELEVSVDEQAVASLEVPVAPRPIAAPPVEVPPPAPAPVPSRQNPLSVQASVGFFAAGGANLGPALELGAGWRLPLWEERVAAELGLGLRTASLARELDSSLVAFPVFAGARARLYSLGPWALHARAGIGAVPFRHAVQAPAQADFAEGGLGFYAFGGAQGSWRLSSIEVLLDVRGEWARTRTPHLLARPGGLHLGVGARWGLP